MSDCVFCKIAKKEIPTDLLFENESLVAFNSVPKQTPVHVLIIPKKHIPTIDDLREEDVMLMGQIIIVAQRLARELNISEKGYKLLFRVKEHGEQEIKHIHLHLLGGAQLTEKIKAI